MSFPNIPNINPLIGSTPTCEGNSTFLSFPTDTDPNAGWTITFVSFDPNTQTYCYSVDAVGQPQGLSHWTIGVDCPPEILATFDVTCTRSDGVPQICEIVITPDENEVPGIKFDNIQNLEFDNPPVTFCVTINNPRPLFLGCVLASGKAGQLSDTGDNTIPGPSCTPNNPFTTDQVIPLLLSSIAFEELALAHIMNAEAEKLQFVLGTLTPTRTTFSPATVNLTNLLALDASVQRTLRDVIKKEMLLEFKFENILDLISITPLP